MESMFENASEFNKDLSNWKNQVKADVNTQSMFTGNAPICQAYPIWKKANGTKICFSFQANHENIVAFDRNRIAKKNKRSDNRQVPSLPRSQPSRNL